MRYANLIKNDVVNGKKVCVSLFMQGCPHHCKNCFNPETWDFNGGKKINIEDLINEIKQALTANGVERNFSILGGEPLCPENRDAVASIMAAIKQAFPRIKIFLWTGYTLDYLQEKAKEDLNLDFILSNINYLIDGPFEEENKAYNLWLRGSTNQNIYKLTKDKNFVIIN